MSKHNAARITGHQLRRWCMAAGLLVALAGARFTYFRAPPEAEAYLKRIATAVAETPTNFGQWVSEECPVPPAAITMLHPNATVSRRYTNLQTGQQATLLLVQCGDANDLRGHYPPICYKANGYNVVAVGLKNLTVAGLTTQGTLYRCTSTHPEAMAAMVIYDFMILPDGRTCPDMVGVDAIARSPRQRYFGAAQLQILVDPSLPADQRDALFITLVQANRRTIDAILAGDR